MTYINVGAFVNGTRPKAKKALREALANAPETVLFDQTALPTFAPATVAGTVRATEIPTGVTLSVVGPDPFTARRWYASVTRDRGGQVRIS